MTKTAVPLRCVVQEIQCTPWEHNSTLVNIGFTVEGPISKIIRWDDKHKLIARLNPKADLRALLSAQSEMTRLFTKLGVHYFHLDRILPTLPFRFSTGEAFTVVAHSLNEAADLVHNKLLPDPHGKRRPTSVKKNPSEEFYELLVRMGLPGDVLRTKVDVSTYTRSGTRFEVDYCYESASLRRIRMFHGISVYNEALIDRVAHHCRVLRGHLANSEPRYGLDFFAIVEPNLNEKFNDETKRCWQTLQDEVVGASIYPSNSMDLLIDVRQDFTSNAFIN